jgi:hypothetical protein
MQTRAYSLSHSLPFFLVPNFPMPTKYPPITWLRSTTVAIRGRQIQLKAAQVFTGDALRRDN